MAAFSSPEKLVPSQDNLQNVKNNKQQLPSISPKLQRTLQHLVDSVVDALSCVGAIVTTLETDNSLPIRAYSFNVSTAFTKQLANLFNQDLLGAKTVTYLDDDRFKDNLGVRAIQGGEGKPEKFLTSDNLYDMFRPTITKSVAQKAQDLADIKQVIAVPFYLEDNVVGNLFAAAGQNFTLRDIHLLTAFGHQAAAAIQTQRRLAEIQALERVILALQTTITDETQTLQTIVDAMVEKLGYAGAIVATLEANNALPVRAYRIDLATRLLNHLEEKAGLRLLSPEAVVYVDDKKFKDNLALRAINGAGGKPEKFVISDRLYDLFRPIAGKELSNLAQKLMGIKQVIAVPFFLEDEVVGNIFVATRKPRFTNREKELLTTFGQQAAVGIRNARLYRKAEEQRQIAQMFAKMAFGATANIHALRNHIGAFQTYVRLIELTVNMPAEERAELLDTGPNILNHLNKSADILDNLHEPWRQTPDIPTDVNSCLNWATRKVFSRIPIDLEANEIDAGEGIIIHRSLADKLPFVKTSPDMLIEALRVIIKNAVEAITEKKKNRMLWLKSGLNQTEDFIEVIIQDNGTGIKADNLAKIFEIGWSSKRGQGMGFGLFWTKDYIEGLGGIIKVESKWKKGTTFSVSLPVSVEVGSKK